MLTSNETVAEKSDWAPPRKNELYEGGKWEPLKLFDKARDILNVCLKAILWGKLIL